MVIYLYEALTTMGIDLPYICLVPRVKKHSKQDHNLSQAAGRDRSFWASPIPKLPEIVLIYIGQFASGERILVECHGDQIDPKIRPLIHSKNLCKV
jgi:hypothetical protein